MLELFSVMDECSLWQSLHHFWILRDHLLNEVHLHSQKARHEKEKGMPEHLVTVAYNSQNQCKVWNT